MTDHESVAMTDWAEMPAPSPDVVAGGTARLSESERAERIERAWDRAVTDLAATRWIAWPTPDSALGAALDRRLTATAGWSYGRPPVAGRTPFHLPHEIAWEHDHEMEGPSGA